MKKVIGIIVIILMIPVIISVIGDIDRTPVYPTTEFNIEKLTRISSLDIENNDIELLKLPNGVGDKWLSDGRIEKNVEKLTVDSSMNWIFYSPQTATTVATFSLDVGITHIEYTNTGNAISSLFPQGNYFGYEYEIFNFRTNGYLYISIKKSRIPDWDDNWTGTQKVNAFKQWLQNPITIYYQLETPTIENAPTLPEFIDFYDGGSVIVDDGIIDYTVVGNQAQINYIEGNITTVVDEQFKISKPTKIISKSNDLYDYDLSTLPNYLEYGTLPQGTYENILEFINDNQNKDVKIYYNDIIQEHRFNTYLENSSILLSNDTEFITIYEDDTYTSTLNLDTDITYKLEGYNILEYIDGEFDNTVLAFFWIIPVLLVGGLIYLLLKRKE